MRVGVETVGLLGSIGRLRAAERVSPLIPIASF